MDLTTARQTVADGHKVVFKGKALTLSADGVLQHGGKPFSPTAEDSRSLDYEVGEPGEEATEQKKVAPPRKRPPAKKAAAPRKRSR